VQFASKSCAKCGAEFYADAPQEYCSACLLETGLFTDQPLVADGERAGTKADNTSVHGRQNVTDFGDYELLEKLGSGGQGLVYRARQRSLDRTVALKIVALGQLATTRHLKRFHLEAQAAARLDHPGIVPIYEIGEREGSCYFSMKLIDGGSLDEVVEREPMSPRRAAEFIAKVARIVHYANEHGILHRDIKPGNILVDGKGEPHLTDFGLARLLEAESTVTRTMEVMGTPSYMAPEQAMGNNATITCATDVYGLGAVFYHLLTGHPPFAGETTYETVRLVLEEEPRQPRLWNPKIDRDLATICLKCLEKDPGRRYDSALALAEDLERWLKHEPIRARSAGIFGRSQKWVRRNPMTALLFALSFAFVATLGVIIWRNESARPPAGVGVAVLPFVNMSGDKENEYLSDGITEDLCAALSQVKGLRVPARTSSFAFKGKTGNVYKIGKELNVPTVLEGSVSRAGNKLRVTAQLIKVADGFHLWAATYDRDMTDILAVRSDISQRVVDALKLQLGVEEKQRLARNPTENHQAYELYLLGRFELSKLTEQSAHNSIQFFQQAIALDPEFALAHAGLAEAYNLIGYWSYVPPKEAFPKAKQAAQKALALDPNLAEAHATLGYSEFQYEWNFKEAETEFRKAVALNPNSVTARLNLWEYLLDLGRTQEAHQELERAREMDPLSYRVNFGFIWQYMTEGDLDRAAQQTEKTIAIDPKNPLGYDLLTAISFIKKMPAEYFAAAEKRDMLDGSFSAEELGELRKAYDTGGVPAYSRKRNEFCQKRIAQGKYESPLRIAIDYAVGGFDSEALDWLEKAVEERTPWLPELKIDLAWDRLRSQPRFIAILKKIGLEK
jgi:serine/threonine-protein kinase